MTDISLRALATRLGIVSEFRDFSNTTVTATTDTLRALVRANGICVDNDAMIHEAHLHFDAQQKDRFLRSLYILESGSAFQCTLDQSVEWQIHSKESGQLIAESRHPQMVNSPALASGIYQLSATIRHKREHALLLVAPKTAPQLLELGDKSRIWGINCALYGLHSERNMGPGDYADLAAVAELVAEYGADFLGINPLHARGYYAPEVISPYSPTHRAMLDTSAIALDQIIGLPKSTVTRVHAQTQRVLAHANQDNLVDYTTHRPVHSNALEELFDCFLEANDNTDKRRFHEWMQQQDTAFHSFIHYETLAEQYGDDWRKWPSELRNNNSEIVKQNLIGKENRLEFHAWLQWNANHQLEQASIRANTHNMTPGLYLDLAVGSRLGGAESWCEHTSTALGVSLGAPPDHLAPEGQNWQLSAWSPAKLRALDFLPYQQMLRAVMRHAGMLRIDHVLGLNRSYWIPDDGSPGAYIEQPMVAMLAIIKIEAHRQNSLVIGEDLGLVPAGFRETMRKNGLYGYSVMQFEKREGVFTAPNDYDPRVLACFGTHDTTTIEGYRQCRDIDAWRALNWIDKSKTSTLVDQRSKDVAALNSMAFSDNNKLSLSANENNNYNNDENQCDIGSKPQFADNIHNLLAQSPVAMVSVQLDDILGVADAQNLPGTVAEYPNWRRRLPKSLSKVRTLIAWQRLKEIMQISKRLR